MRRILLIVSSLFAAPASSTGEEEKEHATPEKPALQPSGIRRGGGIFAPANQQPARPATSDTNFDGYVCLKTLL